LIVGCGGLGIPVIEKIEKLNPDVKVVPYNTKLTSQNALEMMKEYDMVADCSDNFPTRYLVNDACVMLDKPLSRGAVPRFEGLLMTILPKVSACYRCVFEKPSTPGTVPSCREAGIPGATCGTIESLQAMEVIKYSAGVGGLLTGKLLVFYGLTFEFFTIDVKRNEKCPVCGDEPEIASLIDHENSCEG